MKAFKRLFERCMVGFNSCLREVAFLRRCVVSQCRKAKLDVNQLRNVTFTEGYAAGCEDTLASMRTLQSESRPKI